MGRRKQQRPAWLENPFIPWEALTPAQQDKAKWYLGQCNPRRHKYQLDDEGCIRCIHHVDGDAGTIVQFKPKPKAEPKSMLLTVRLDEDVVEWFKNQGDIRLTRLNEIVRAQMLKPLNPSL